MDKTAPRHYITVMRKTIGLAVLLICSVVPAFANDSPTATKFLRTYVGALQLTRAGDALAATGECGAAHEQYAQARDLIAPYTIRDPKRQLEMEESAMLFVKALDRRAACSVAIRTVAGGLEPLAASGVKAAWAIENNPASVDRLWVGYRDRQHAIHDLEHAFGPIASGPRADQNDLETAAASVAYVLANPPQEVFVAQPRVLGNVYH
jgi:hypothetical protein